MSNALAISGVTAVLQYCLTRIYGATSALGAVTVTAQTPDVVAANFAKNDSQLLVNVFLHQVTPNASWRNADLPSLAPDGTKRLRRPALALDLHYLLTMYATEDLCAEALLGYAAQMLHEYPVLARSEIRAALNAVPSTNSLSGALTTTGLADQIEMIKITPSTLGREEVAWIWTALKADYHLSYPIDVGVVLIESPYSISFALPVLSRNIAAQGGQLANLTAGLPAHLLAVQPPAGQTASAPGDTVIVSGQSLSGASQVALMNQRLDLYYPPFAPSAVTPTSVSFTVPDDASKLPAGIYNLWLIFTGQGGAILSATNILSLAIAPKILPPGPGAAVSNAAGTLVTITCSPEVLPSQNVSLSLAGAAVPAQPFTAPTTTLTFQFPALAAGSYVVQLQVDGIDSPIEVQWTPLPPVFTGPILTI
jgi:hypothetical protein